jgi:ribosome-binding protein aMBF1 (putative translation factor)
MEADIMAAEHIRKPRESDLTPAQRARVDAIRAKNRSAEHRADETRVRENLEREYRDKKAFETTGDGTTMGSLVEFRRFVMSLRRERERQGLSLSDVAERAEIDKAALSRLENGQQLNPTVNTLARYAGALGSTLKFALGDPEQDPSGTPLSADRVTHKRLDPNG